MRRVVLHIGLPRTGSTSLQFVWARHREALERLGILYPDLTPAAAEMPHINHQYLSQAMDGRRPAGELEELLGRLGQQLRGDADTVILSYEILAHRDPSAPGIARLLQLLRGAGCVPETLVVVKSPAEAANSHYTIGGLFLQERRDFAGFLRGRGLRVPLDLPARLLPWRDAGEGMTALPLRDPADGAPLVTRVWRAVGILDRAGHLLDAEDLRRRENPSPGPVAIEACRRLAAAGLRAGRDDEACRRITRAVESALHDRGGEAGGFRGYDGAIAAEIEARWARGNDRFAAAVWGTAWSARVPPPAPGPANELAGTGDPDGLRLCEEVLAECCGRLGLPVPGPVPPTLLARVSRLLPGLRRG
jgi:hypothetical protein